MAVIGTVTVTNEGRPNWRCWLFGHKWDPLNCRQIQGKGRGKKAYWITKWYRHCTRCDYTEEK